MPHRVQPASQSAAMRMVLGFYGLAEQPFGVSPDPRFFFPSPTHREALASALCAISSGRGFTALIAKPGMGKTTLLFDLLKFVEDQAKTAFLFQSQCTPRDLLGNLLEDLEIQDDFTDFARMQRKLNNCLLNESKHGRQVVVIIDEAQNLDDSLLEVVRMLSNFETASSKLMHFVLAGQTQLAEKLASPRMLQLKQRISIVARLDPFSPQEVHSYIDHRLGVAAYSLNRPLFSKQALSLIADASEGIPRNINNICFNALSIGYVSRQSTIDADVIREVLNDLDFRLRFCEPVPAVVTSKPIAPAAIAAAHPDIPEGPSLLSTNHLDSSSSSKRLVLTFALVLGLLIVSLSVFFLWTRHRSTSLLASTPTKVAATSATDPMSDAPAPADPVLIVSPSQPEPMEPANASLAVVQPNQTLYRIIVKNFGQYNETTVDRIRALNPWLTDERRIRVGQLIRLRPDTDKPPKMLSLAADVSRSQNPQQMGKGTE